MKNHSSNQRTLQNKTSPVGENSSAGPDGAVIAPPVYGLDTLDGSTQTIQQKADPSAAGGDALGSSAPNQTGLPDNLKAGVESLSGLALDDVRVHTNSSKPHQLQALAYTQGSDIHVAPGQERHLPHEAWHVVQQKQGRVKPTIQMKGRIPVNDNAGLEHEADVMGKASHDVGCGCAHCSPVTVVKNAPTTAQPVQRKIAIASGVDAKEITDPDVLLTSALSLDNSIPGTVTELKAAIDTMLADETPRTLLAEVISGLQSAMAENYEDVKNIASLSLRMKFPDKAFLDTDTAEDLAKFTKNEILGKDVDAEVGYLIDPKTGKAVAIGLGAARVVQPHEIGADATSVKWAGKTLIHSHPSGSPHTVPNDITAAITGRATKSIVQTRDFTFTIAIDYENEYIKECMKDERLTKLKEDLGKSDNKVSWPKKAVEEGYDGFKYNSDNTENAQEKAIQEGEFKTKVGPTVSQWKMTNDYCLDKFVGFLQIKEDFSAKGLTLDTNASLAAYIAYRQKFYKGAKGKGKAAKKPFEMY